MSWILRSGASSEVLGRPGWATGVTWDSYVAASDKWWLWNLRFYVHTYMELKLIGIPHSMYVYMHVHVRVHVYYVYVHVHV